MKESADSEDESGDHLEEVPDGAGCTGIWEHLSKQRNDGEEAEE